MSSPNFGSILDKAPSEIERPKPLPIGSFTCQIEGLPRFDKSSKKQTEFVEFTARVLLAGDDVDAEALAEIGGIPDKTIKLTYYLTENSAYRLKDFLVDDLQLEEKESLREMLDDTPGCQFIAHIKHEPSEDGKSVYANVKSTAPAA